MKMIGEIILLKDIYIIFLSIIVQLACHEYQKANNISDIIRMSLNDYVYYEPLYSNNIE